MAILEPRMPSLLPATECWPYFSLYIENVRGCTHQAALSQPLLDDHF